MSVAKVRVGTVLQIGDEMCSRCALLSWFSQVPEQDQCAVVRKGRVVDAGGDGAVAR